MGRNGVALFLLVLGRHAHVQHGRARTARSRPIATTAAVAEGVVHRYSRDFGTSLSRKRNRLLGNVVDAPLSRWALPPLATAMRKNDPKEADGVLQDLASGLLGEGLVVVGLPELDRPLDQLAAPRSAAFGAFQLVGGLGVVGSRRFARIRGRTPRRHGKVNAGPPRRRRPRRTRRHPAGGGPSRRWGPPGGAISRRSARVTVSPPGGAVPAPSGASGAILLAADCPGPVTPASGRRGRPRGR